MTWPPAASMTSGSNATNSAASLRMRSAAPVPQRYSIRTLRPSLQPSRCSSRRNAAMRACPSGSSAPNVLRMPIRRVRSPCPRAASGHAAAPQTRAINLRRVTGPSHARWLHRIPHLAQCALRNAAPQLGSAAQDSYGSRTRIVRGLTGVQSRSAIASGLTVLTVRTSTHTPCQWDTSNDPIMSLRLTALCIASALDHALHHT
jgi:hypothetical protein